MEWERGRFKSDGGGTFELHAIKILPRAELQGRFSVLLGVPATPDGSGRLGRFVVHSPS